MSNLADIDYLFQSPFAIAPYSLSKLKPKKKYGHNGWHDNWRDTWEEEPVSPLLSPIPGKMYLYGGKVYDKEEIVPSEVPKHIALMRIPLVDDYLTEMVGMWGDTRGWSAKKRKMKMEARLETIDDGSEQSEEENWTPEEPKSKVKVRVKARARGRAQLDGCDDFDESYDGSPDNPSVVSSQASG